MMTAQTSESFLTDERPLVTPDLAHIRELDGIRGIAVLAVFCHHVCHVSAPELWPAPIRAILTVSLFGAAGVDLFFVLSGFLITSLLIKAQARPRYYQDFYWKRVLRILPLYLFCLVGVLAFFPHSGTYVLMSLLFIANLAPYFHVSNMGGPFWTLAIEEQFYLLWPTVVRKLRVKTIERVALTVVFATILFRVVWALRGHWDYAFLFARADGLALGAFIACRYRLWTSQGGWGKRDAFTTAGGLVSAILLFYACSLLPEFALKTALYAALYQAALTILLGAFVAFSVAKSGASYLGFLRSRALCFFGLISYAVYLFHLWVMYTYDRFHPLIAGSLPEYFLRLFVILCGSILFALATRYAIELPALNLRKYVIPSSRERPGN